MFFSQMLLKQKEDNSIEQHVLRILAFLTVQFS